MVRGVVVNRLCDAFAGLHGEEKQHELIQKANHLLDNHCQAEPNVYLQQLGVRPCMICNHNPNINGYPQKYVKDIGSCNVAHLMWMMRNLEIPPEGDFQYSHRCMNPACVEPSHGEWVSRYVDAQRKKCRSAAYVVTDPVLSESYIHKLCPCDPPCLTVKVLGQDTRDAWIEGEQAHMAARGTFPVNANGHAIPNLTRKGNRRKVRCNKGKLNRCYVIDPELMQSLCQECEQQSVEDEGSLLPGLDVAGLGPCLISTMPIKSGTDRCHMKTTRVSIHGKEHYFRPWHVCWIARNGRFPRHLEYDHWCHNGNCINPNHGGPNSFWRNQSRTKCQNCSIVVDEAGYINLICPHKVPCLVVKVLDETTRVHVQAVQRPQAAQPPVENTQFDTEIFPVTP